MPFQYQPYTNPFAGSIASTLEQPGRIAADEARAVAAANARAMEQRGQAWAGVGQQIAQIPQQIAQSQELAQRAKLQQSQIDENQIRVAQQQRALKGQQLLGQLVQQNSTTDPVTGHITVNHEAVAQGLTANAYGDEAQSYLHGAAQTAEDIDKIASGKRATANATAEAVGRAANSATTPADFLNRIDHLAVAGAIDPQVRDKFATEVQQAGADGWADVKKRYVDWADTVVKPITTKAGDTTRQGVSGAVISSEAEKLTPEQAKIDSYIASIGLPNGTKWEALTPTQRAGFKEYSEPAAVNALRLTDAYVTKDNKPVLTNEKGEFFDGDKKPLKASDVKRYQAPEPADVAAIRAQQLQADKDKNAPIDVSPRVQTTMLAGGMKYLDASQYTPAEEKKAREAAEKAGIPVVSKDVAAGLESADRAAINLNTMWQQLSPYLAKDAAGRLVTGPSNTLEKVFQTNPTLGAYGSWRIAAIQGIQALAEKGMGLRLNQVEINQMIDSLPKASDDGPTAKKKLDDIHSQLEAKVKVALTGDRRSLDASAPAPSTAPPLTPGLQGLANRSPR